MIITKAAQAVAAQAAKVARQKTRLKKAGKKIVSRENLGVQVTREEKKAPEEIFQKAQNGVPDQFHSIVQRFQLEAFFL